MNIIDFHSQKRYSQDNKWEHLFAFEIQTEVNQYVINRKNN